MDATASRARTWDMACQLQGQMFVHPDVSGKLQLQLVYFRGYDECKASKWLDRSSDLLRMMSSVRCLAGQTQIQRVLKHTLAQARSGQVDALVYVGDSMEESVDELGALAGQLRLLQVPMLIFQEGYDPAASFAFKQFATLSAGAHCHLDQNSAEQLGELLRAAAIYATAGKSGLEKFARTAGSRTRQLLSQLNPD